MGTTIRSKRRPEPAPENCSEPPEGPAPAKRRAEGPSGAPSASKAHKPAAKEGKSPKAAAASPPSDAPIKVSRAPLLKLWVAVVAQRQGFAWREAVTFGKVVAGWTAKSKGKKLGIYGEREGDEEGREELRRQDAEMGAQRLDVFGLKVPAVQVDGEWHAVADGEPVQPGSVEGVLKRAFGARLPDAKAALEALADAIPVDCVGEAALSLYERFRPEWQGWGVPSELSLTGIRVLADSWE